MAVYFADSSSLARRYVAETGSVWLRALLDPMTGNVPVMARITAVELIAAFTRRARGGSLTTAHATVACADLRTHLASEYQIVEVDERVINQAMLLAEIHGLRGYDAVQLAGALEVNAQYLTAGHAPITLLSADTELNAAATTSGLNVEDPNTHP